MIHIKAPQDPRQDWLGCQPNSLFLAGGITGCPNWQDELAAMLEPIVELAVFNPRRENWPKNGNVEEVRRQIAWEHKWLASVNDVLFWFSRGSLNPIVLFEYGKELGRQGDVTFQHRRLFVGVDPEYPRKLDVEVQTGLANKFLTIADSLKTLAAQVTKHYASR